MKSIFGYVTCFVMALIYTLLWDVHWGVLILAVLLIAPALSVALAFFARNKLTISFQNSVKTLGKGEECVLSATFKKSGFLPVPAVEIDFFNDWKVAGDQQRYVFSVDGNAVYTLKKNYRTEIWGQAKIGLKEVFIVDYLGFVRFPLYQEKGFYTYAASVEILPNIPEAPVRNELMQTLQDTVAYDEDEETLESRVRTSGVPGYEHRAYVPGDSIRKINWKLSSKRDVLLIRLDEAIAGTKHVLILDCCSGTNDGFFQDAQELQILDDERIIEAFLAFSALLVKQDAGCVVYLYDKDHWTQRTVSSYDDVVALQQFFAKYRFQSPELFQNGTRIPLDEFGSELKNSAIAFFTSSFDSGLSGDLQQAQQRGIAVHTVVPSTDVQSIENTWIVKDSFEFVRI